MTELITLPRIIGDWMRRPPGHPEYPWEDLLIGECFHVLSGDADTIGHKAYRVGKRLGLKFSIKDLYLVETGRVVLVRRVE